MSTSKDTGRVKSIYEDRYRNIITKLVERRKSLPMTQQELAASLGWERTVINKIENCIRRIDVIETAKICRALGIRLTDILDEDL
jgi:transcriptional regulator with XRE-family HTH domain